MRRIRSLLWIGSGRGLAESGMTEAPELDVTWAPSLEAALRLPRVRFEGVLLETRSLESLSAALPALARAHPDTPTLVSLPAALEARASEALALGSAANNRWVVSRILGNLGKLAADQGDLDEAARCYQAALVHSQYAGNAHSEATLLINLGMLFKYRNELAC